MYQRKEFLLYFLFMFLAVTAFAGDNSTITIGNDTLANGLTKNESTLFNMINDMRMQNKLASIPLSKDLCIVAQTHIADLIKWKPQDIGCSLHSWSGSGKWTSCCNTKEVFGIQCMKSKPREITGYAGDGYELIYWGEENATPLEAASLWRDVETSADMILSRNKWYNYQWKALGVGIKEGYAVLWLGDTIGIETIDHVAENVTLTKQIVEKESSVDKAVVSEKKGYTTELSTKKKQLISATEVSEKPVYVNGTQFHVIVGSYKESDAADAELKKVKLLGYPSSFILHQEPLYRIAIASFEVYDKAAKMKNELKETFPGIWIYKK